MEANVVPLFEEQREHPLVLEYVLACPRPLASWKHALQALCLSALASILLPPVLAGVPPACSSLWTWSLDLGACGDASESLKEG